MSNSIFGNSAGKEGEFKDKVDTHSKALLTVTQRQKDLESTVDLLSDKLDLLDHNSVGNFKRLNQEIKGVRMEIKELRDEISLMKEFNSKVSKQMKLIATKDEVTKLEKYIDLWDPMNFLTRSEMDDFRVKIKKDFEEIIEKFLKE